MLALPIFTVSSNYRFAVKPVRWTVLGEHDSVNRKPLQDTRKTSVKDGGLCWRYLFSRPVARQLSSAQVSLTSVFGMGTGGPSPQSTPTVLSVPQDLFNYTALFAFVKYFFPLAAKKLVTRGRVELPFAA